MLKPFLFIWSSRVLEGCITTWGISTGRLTQVTQNTQILTELGAFPYAQFVHCLGKKANKYEILKKTDLGDDHLLLGSEETHQPLTHVEDHGAHHPLPCLQQGQRQCSDSRSKAWLRRVNMFWKRLERVLTMGGFPANSG